MPTPVGHMLAGLAVWAIARRPKTFKEAMSAQSLGWAALCVIASNIPDADFLSFSDEGIGFTGRFHHGATHSIGFAAGMGVMVWGWAWIRKARFAARAAALTTLLYSLHIFLDLFNVDTYMANGVGLPLLWPFTKAYYIYPLLPGTDRVDIISLGNLKSVGLEIAIYGTALLAAVLWGARKRSVTGRS